MSDAQPKKSFERYRHVGLAIDPIHVGAGGARLGRVDNTIVRDPATKLPKIPGSSLAGVLRTYVAMEMQTTAGPRKVVNVKDKPYYPDCAGQGQPRRDGSGGHCCEPSCKVCTVFGFARGKDSAGGFAGLASFSDMHLLLFPVATREGPVWVTSPGALRLAGIDQGIDDAIKDENRVYRMNATGETLNLGWLQLEVGQLGTVLDGKLDAIPDYIWHRIAVVSDKLFSHVVNSNLEVRTSVAIDASTGAAEEGALFTYEALPRSSVLCWDVICKYPGHFQIGNRTIDAVASPDDVHNVVMKGHPYLAALGIGGMGTRGMGRLEVLEASSSAASTTQEAQAGGGT